MKTTANTTILSILLTLVMMVSCSTEGDILDDMSKVEAPATTGVAAAISCSITNVMTKTGGTTQPAEDGTNESVKSVMFFLMKGDQVLGYKANATATIYTKKQSGMTVIAVANASQATCVKLANATTRNEIETIVFVASDLESLVKYGESSEITVFTEEGKTVTATASVAVNQVAARIDLVKVNVTKVGANEVTLTKVELFDQVVEGRLDGTVVKQGETAIGTLNTTPDGNVCKPLYSFAGKKVSLRLTFKVDGVDQIKSFTVKHNGSEEVKGGYVYRVTFNAKVSGENVEPQVTFEVVDWKTSTVTGDMTDM